MCTFTLRPILPERRNETRFLGREIHPYQSDPFPPILYYIWMSDKQDEPHNLLHLGRAHNAIRLHWKLTKNSEDLLNLFVPGWQSTSVPSGEDHHVPKCTWPWVATQHKPSNPIPPRCFIKVVNFRSLRSYPQPKLKGSSWIVAKHGKSFYLVGVFRMATHY